MSDEEKMRKVMMQALAPMLQAAGLPANFLEMVTSIKVRSFEQVVEPESNTIYATIVCEDTESLGKMSKLANLFIEQMKAKKE